MSYSRGIIMQKRPDDFIIEEKIRRVNGALTQEGMPLSKEIISKLYQIFAGEASTTTEREKLLMKYKNSRESKNVRKI